MTLLESSVEEDLITAVKAARGLCLKLPASLYRGIPDRLVLLPGARVFFVELKRDKRKLPSIHQIRFRETLLTLGLQSVIIQGKTQLQEFIKDHVESRL